LTFGGEEMLEKILNLFRDDLTKDLIEVDHKMEKYRGRRLSPEEEKEYQSLKNEEETIQMVRRFNAMKR